MLHLEIILLIISISLTAICLVLGIVIALKIFKKKTVGIESSAEFDLVLNNLSDIYKLLEHQIGTQAKSSQDVILSAFNASNSSFIGVLNPYLENNKSSIEKINNTISNQLQEMRVEMKDNFALIRRDIGDTLREVRTEMKENISQMRADMGTNLSEVRQDNAKQLEAMRTTVDEKLTSTLDTRIKSAFQIVNDRLDAVQQGFGEMKMLSDKVGNLNKVFNNVKTRGGWGEVALESLLEQILSAEQYEKQFRINKAKEIVDFAIVMPGQAGEKVYLPIDCKFPTADYELLVDAVESDNNEESGRCRKALYDRIKTFAQSISNKYILPPHTTDFAIMYLPTEGLYAEIIRNGALVSDLQSKYKILVCGPTTITALLNSLQVGFTTLKIQKRSGEIVQLMNAFQKDFGNFTELISKVKEKAQGVVNSLEDVNKRNEIIKKKLAKAGDTKDLLPNDSDNAVLVQGEKVLIEVNDED